MATPSPSWDLVRVYGTWVGDDGTLLAGTYKASIPSRVTNSTDDRIIPAGIFATGALQTSVLTSPSLDLLVPATDDPDIEQTGWKMNLLITFAGGAAQELYVIDIPYADRPVAAGGTGRGVNLRTIALSSASIPQTNALYRIGVAGGLAKLNSNGDVIDANGNVILSGGGGGGGAVSSVAGRTGAITLTKTDVGLGNVDNTADTAKVVASAGKLTTGRTIDGVTFDGTANVTVLPAATHAATAKATPADTDELPVADSAATFGLKKFTLLALKSWISSFVATSGTAAKLTTARTIAGVSFDGSVNIPIGFANVGAVGYCIESGGVYPGRPAGAAPVIFIGPDAPPGGGTTGGGAGAVNGLDTWQVTAS